MGFTGSALFIFALILAIVGFISFFIASRVRRQLATIGVKYAKAIAVVTFIVSFLLIFVVILVVIAYSFPFER